MQFLQSLQRGQKVVSKGSSQDFESSSTKQTTKTAISTPTVYREQFEKSFDSADSAHISVANSNIKRITLKASTAPARPVPALSSNPESIPPIVPLETLQKVLASRRYDFDTEENFRTNTRQDQYMPTNIYWNRHPTLNTPAARHEHATFFIREVNPSYVSAVTPRRSTQMTSKSDKTTPLSRTDNSKNPKAVEEDGGDNPRTEWRKLLTEYRSKQRQMEIEDSLSLIKPTAPVVVKSHEKDDDDESLEEAKARVARQWVAAVIERSKAAKKAKS